jgi:hypothetical protein
VKNANRLAIILLVTLVMTINVNAQSDPRAKNANTSQDVLYYQYLFQKNPSVKDILKFDNSKARIEALVNLILLLNKNVNQAFTLASPVFYSYMDQDTKYIISSRPPESVLKKGVNDIYSGNYNSYEALHALEAYRRFLADPAATSALKLRGENQLIANVLCNEAWFAYAVTQPQGTESYCSPLIDESYGEILATLQPRYVSGDLSSSVALTQGLNNLSQFMSTYQYNLGGQVAANQESQKYSLIANIDFAIKETAINIQSAGGQIAWKDLSDLDSYISRLDNQIGNQSDLRSIRSIKNQIATLCQKRRDKFPNAKEYNLCR